MWKFSCGKTPLHPLPCGKRAKPPTSPVDALSPGTQRFPPFFHNLSSYYYRYDLILLFSGEIAILTIGGSAMKFSCEKALLQAAISTTSRAVSPKSSIPALEGILVEAGNELRLTGYNLETGIRTVVPADIQQEGTLVLGARLFGEIIASCPTTWSPCRPTTTPSTSSAA